MKLDLYLGSALRVILVKLFIIVGVFSCLVRGIGEFVVWKFGKQGVSNIERFGILRDFLSFGYG